MTEEAGIPSGYIIINIKEHCRDLFHSNEKLRMLRDLWLITMDGFQFSSQKAKFKGSFERKKRDFVRPSLIRLRLAESPGETRKE